MFKFVNTLRPDSFVNDGNYMRLIFWRDVFLKPGKAWALCICKKTLTIEIMHLTPIRAHTIHRFRTSRYQSTKALLTYTLCLLSLLAFHDTFLAETLYYFPFAFSFNQSKLVI